MLKNVNYTPPDPEGVHRIFSARATPGEGPPIFWPYPAEVPPKVARRFVRDMPAFFAEKDAIKAGAIAAQQLSR